MTEREAALAALRVLSECGVEFALLHGYGRLIAGDISDVDVVVSRHPRRVVEVAGHRWVEAGLYPVVLWAYDVGGTTTVFLVNRDATVRVQLDLLFDPAGVGKYGARSTELLQRVDHIDQIPVVSQEASLVYQWAKRVVKNQTDRLEGLRSRAENLPAFGSAAGQIVGSPGLARRIAHLEAWKSRPTLGYLARNLVRLVRRVAKPVGYWVHLQDETAARGVHTRFAGLLPRTGFAAMPSGVWARSGWFWREVQPVRLRPGLFVSYGRSPRAPRPDLVVPHSVDTTEACRRIVTAMASRHLV